MSDLKKARLHSINVDGSIGEDVDVLTSGDAVTLNNGKNLEDIYQNEIGDITKLNTSNKDLVNAVNENTYDIKTNATNIKNISADLSDIVTYDITKHELYDANDISLAINAIKTVINNGDKLLLPSGSYKSAHIIDLNFLLTKQYIRIELNGDIEYTGTDETCLFISGQNLSIYVNHIYKNKGNFDDTSCNYDLLSNTAIKFDLLYHSNVHINQIEYFSTAIHLTPSNNQGQQYNNIKFDYLKHNKTGLKFEVQTDLSWSTESVYTGGRIRGYDGILFVKRETQSDTYNNNRFMFIGMEDITHNGFELHYCSATTIYHSRFERVAYYFVYEDSDCSYTYIYTPYRVLTGNIELKGSNSICNGTIGIKGNNNYNVIYKTTDKNKISRYYDCGFQPVPITLSYKQINAFNTDVSIEHGIKVIYVKTDSASVNLTVDNGIWDNDGYEFYIDIRDFTNTLQILNPSGGIAIHSYCFTQTGVYKVINSGGQWLLVTRIGTSLAN